MKRFYSRKIKKISRSKLIYFYFVMSIFLLICANLLINIFFSNINSTQFLNKLLYHSYGLTKPEYHLLYYNAFGLNYKKSSKVNSDNPNIEELLIQEPNAPIIYIYNTFQTAKYKNNYYNSYNINPVITQASLIFQEYLKNYNLSSYVEIKSVAKTLKENKIEYTNSYKGSRILLENAQASNPNLKYFFDLQMSDYDYNITTTTINNENYAKILFVIGTDNVNYALNQKFAQDLNTIITSSYPEISRGISLRGGIGYHGIYNEDFNPNTLLIQIGGKENTIAEVNRTLNILAYSLKVYIERKDTNEKN